LRLLFVELFLLIIHSWVIRRFHIVKFQPLLCTLAVFFERIWLWIVCYFAYEFLSLCFLNVN